MVPRRWRHFSRRSLRTAVHAAVALATVVAFVWGGLGLVGLPKPQSSVPFPCMDHRCGCASPEECWTNCCCMSPEERLAWAHEHGVQPPPSIAARVLGTAKPACCQCATTPNASRTSTSATDAAGIPPAGTSTAARPLGPGSPRTCKGLEPLGPVVCLLRAPTLETTLPPLPRAWFVLPCDAVLPAPPASDHPTPPPRGC